MGGSHLRGRVKQLNPNGQSVAGLLDLEEILDDAQTAQSFASAKQLFYLVRNDQRVAYALPGKLRRGLQGLGGM